jgi:hypothetical protein
LAAVEGDLVLVTSIFSGLVPDYNHNRQIDEEDRARAAQGDIFYFWINDDDDSGETGGDDIPGDHSLGGELDCRNYKVDGVRDLIDFFPVAFDVKTLVEIFPPNVYSYRLKSADENLNVVFPDLSVATVKNYLTDVETARRLAEAPTKQLRASGEFLATLGEVLSGRTQAKLDKLISAAATQDTSPVILLEGVKPGTAPLVLEIKDQTENQVFTTSLNLSLDGVEQMFRQKNLIKVLSSLEEMGEQEFEQYYIPSVPPVGPEDRLISNDFINSEHFEGFDADNDDNDFIHVHGYNVNDQDARGEQSETFKRLYWSGSQARFWGITWYGWDTQLTVPVAGVGTRTPNYHLNVRRAFETGRLLKDFVVISELSNATIFAHSLGNMVVSSAIAEGMDIGRYLMVNAAVAEEAFTPQSAYAEGGTADGTGAYAYGTPWRTATSAWMYHPAWRYPDGVEVDFEEGYLPKLWASEWYKLFGTDDGRSTLTWRDRFARVRNSDSDSDSEKTYVYYAPTDEAFRPFNYSVEMAATDPDGNHYQPNAADLPGTEDVVFNWRPWDRSHLGYYAFALQELFKGQTSAIIGDDSDTGGWEFNLNPQDGYVFMGVKIPVSLANSYGKEQFRTKPFFSKNPDRDWLYSPQAVSIPSLLKEEMLANEIPALTNAAGHRGVGEIRVDHPDRDIDIRLAFAVGKPWPSDRPRNEWKHSDIYVVAYSYLSGLYDEWVKKIQGATP